MEIVGEPPLPMSKQQSLDSLLHGSGQPFRRLLKSRLFRQGPDLRFCD